MRFFLRLFYMFHRCYSNCRPLNSARYNRIICQTVENTSFFERLSCIFHVLAKGYQSYKSNFGFHIPFDREICQILDQKSVFGFAERNTPLIFACEKIIYSLKSNELVLKFLFIQEFQNLNSVA